MRIAIVALLAAAVAGTARGAEPALSAQAVIQGSLRVEKAPAWTARATLTVKDASRTRVRSGTVFNRVAQRDNSDRLYRFSQPADISGTAFLVRENEPADDDMWMYLPSLGKARRIVSSSKRDSFMASDFSFADLMTMRAADFEHRSLEPEACGAARCYVIESKPGSDKTREAIGFARLLSYIRIGTLQTDRLRYFDDQGVEFKSQVVSDYRKVGSHWIAARREMTLARTGRVSVLELDDIQAQAALSPEVFTEAGLAK